MRVRLHTGTEQVGAVVGRSGRDAAALPGGEVAAILRLERPVAVAALIASSFAGRRRVERWPAARSSTHATARRLAAADDARAAGALAAAATDDAAASARLDLHGAVAGIP